MLTQPLVKPKVDLSPTPHTPPVKLLLLRSFTPSPTRITSSMCSGRRSIKLLSSNWKQEVTRAQATNNSGGLHVSPPRQFGASCSAIRLRVVDVVGSVSF